MKEEEEGTCVVITMWVSVTVEVCVVGFVMVNTCRAVLVVVEIEVDIVVWTDVVI